MSLAKAEAAKPDRIVLGWSSGWAGGGGPAGEDSLYPPPGGHCLRMMMKQLEAWHGPIFRGFQKCYKNS